MINWTSDDAFEIGGVEYVCRALKGGFPSTPDRMLLLKSRWQVEWYEQFLHDVAPELIVEVGMFHGASMALCSELVHPRRLVGFDIREEPSTALEAFIERRHLQANVHPYYGVDQTDAARLNEILDAEFGAERLDLVVDDASHQLDATRATFNCLFPRLAPGGIYVVEDWPMHRLPSVEQPLTHLIFELTLACSETPLAVADLTINRNYALVTRGEADLTSGSFDLSACYGPRERSLLTNPAGTITD